MHVMDELPAYSWQRLRGARAGLSNEKGWLERPCLSRGEREGGTRTNGDTKASGEGCGLLAEPGEDP